MISEADRSEMYAEPTALMDRDESMWEQVAKDEDAVFLSMIGIKP